MSYNKTKKPSKTIEEMVKECIDENPLVYARLAEI